MLHANVVTPFAGTLAEVAALERYVLCDGTNGTPDLRAHFVRGIKDTNSIPGVLGGQATHTHVSSSHTHFVVHHTHTFTTSRINPNPDGRRSGDKQARDHQHTGTTSTTTGSVSGSFTYGAYSNDPPYYDVLFIMATDFALLPNKALLMRDDAELRTNVFFCDGQNNTIDLRDKYLRGAAAGQEIGNTGGSYTHEHSLAHTHVSQHYHTGTTTGNDTGGIGTDGDQNASSKNHNHAMQLNARTDNLENPTQSEAQLDQDGNNVEPAYRHLSVLENLTGGQLMPVKGDIFMWFGAIADIPNNYTICDGQDGTPNMMGRFAKQPNVHGTHISGGSDTHGHPLVTHSHPIPNASHRHSGWTHNNTQNTHTSPHNDANGLYANHSHSISEANVSLANVDYTSAQTTAGLSECVPENVSAVFIRFDFAPGAGSFIMA